MASHLFEQPKQTIVEVLSKIAEPLHRNVAPEPLAIEPLEGQSPISEGATNKTVQNLEMTVINKDNMGQKRTTSEGEGRSIERNAYTKELWSNNNNKEQSKQSTMKKKQ